MKENTRTTIIIVFMFIMLIVAGATVCFVMKTQDKILGFKKEAVTPEPYYNSEEDKFFATVSKDIDNIKGCDLHAEQIIDIESDITCKVKDPWNTCEITDGKNIESYFQKEPVEKELTEADEQTIQDLLRMMVCFNREKEYTITSIEKDSAFWTEENNNKLYTYEIVGETFKGNVSLVKDPDGVPLSMRAEIFDRGYSWIVELTNLSLI